MTLTASPRLLTDILDISRRAGEAILQVYSQEILVEQKEDASPLTQADLSSHRLIVDALNSLTPSVPVLSEESAMLDFSTRSRWNEYWLVDPLDGTKEFIKRNGEFTVNIALVQHHKPVLGVVHVPVGGASYCGLEDAGARRVSASGISEPISVRIPCADPVIVVGSRSHANPALQEHLAALGSFDLVSMGSSLKFCLVAEGKADFYPRLGPTSEWDTAAAHAVVSAAGGSVITLDGEPLRYNTKPSLLNPEFLVFADPRRDWLSLFANYPRS